MANDFGNAAAARAAEKIAKGECIAITPSVIAALEVEVERRRVAVGCGFGSKRTNLGKEKQVIKASNLATSSKCWLCPAGDVNEDFPHLAHEKDHLVGGKDHLYSIASTATAHAFCNRVRGVMQNLGYDVADIVERAQALSTPVRAKAKANSVDTSPFAGML